MKLAVIGTAGRGDDFHRLTYASWVLMCETLDRIAAHYQIDCLVSGGAAWADHVAVAYHLEFGTPIKLHLPGVSGDIKTAERYHLRMGLVLGGSSQAEIARIDPKCIIRGGTFKGRNVRVADDGDVFLAMTFGNGGTVKDGGTKHTVDLMLAQGKVGWHLDLNTGRLHSYGKNHT